MRKTRAPVVLTFRATRQAAVVALVGLVAIVVGFIAPLSAQADSSESGAKVHKSYVCKYVGTPGVDERLQTGDNPIYVDNRSIAGKDLVEVGDLFADAQGFSIVIVANTPKLDPEPGVDRCPGYVPPTTTTTTTTEPPTTTTEPSTRTTTEPPTTTTTEPSTTTTTSQPVVTTPAETPETGATLTPTPEEPGEAATVPPAEQAEAPEVGGVTENVVPQAATDGADLVTGWTGLQRALVASGFLLLAAAGLLSVRRPDEGQSR